MSAEEFWFGDPRLAKAYRMKHWMEIDARNQELWLQGLYIYNAVGVALANSLSKAGRKAKYLEKPLDIVPKTEKQQKAEIEKERENAVIALTKWADRWNSNHKDVMN